jgi:hypothetical protein
MPIPPTPIQISFLDNTVNLRASFQKVSCFYSLIDEKLLISILISPLKTKKGKVEAVFAEIVAFEQ